MVLGMVPSLVRVSGLLGTETSLFASTFSTFAAAFTATAATAAPAMLPVAAVSPASAAAAVTPAATHARAERTDGVHSVSERRFVSRAERADGVHPVSERSFVSSAVPAMLETVISSVILATPATSMIPAAAATETRPDDLVTLVRDQRSRLEEQEDGGDADARSYRAELRGVLPRALVALLAVEAGGERAGPEAVERVLLVVGAVLEVPIEERELVKVFVGDRHVFFFLFP